MTQPFAKRSKSKDRRYMRRRLALVTPGEDSFNRFWSFVFSRKPEIKKSKFWRIMEASAWTDRKWLLSSQFLQQACRDNPGWQDIQEAWDREWQLLEKTA